MSRILLNEVSFSYKKYYEPVFERVTVNLDTDWRLGLIGRNGRGKTTLLRLIHGTLQPDQGSVLMEVKTEVFPYENISTYPKTMDVIKENIGGLRTMEENLENLEVLQEYLDADGYEMESRIKREMNRIELPERLLEQDFDLLSGGEKTKVLMIALFLRKDTFVLLDEPTNHLDLKGKEVIANYLKKKKGFLVISHDRDFLDQVVDHIVSINKTDISVEKGNYTTWKNGKDIREEYENRTRERLIKEIASLENHALTARRWSGQANQQKYAFASHARTNGTRAYMRQARHAEQLVEENLEIKKNLLLNYEEAKTLHFSQIETSLEELIKIKNLSFSYEEKEGKANLLIRDLKFSVSKGDRIWIKGKNGAGKSTLLKLLSGRIPSDLVEREEGLLIGESYQEPLWEEGFLRDYFKNVDGRLKEEFETFQELCYLFDLPEGYQERPLETYSSGEKKKIDIARALTLKSQILFLDEPLNYMDVYFREQLETAILEIEPTVVFVEHDVWFGNCIANKVIEL